MANRNNFSNRSYVNRYRFHLSGIGPILTLIARRDSDARGQYVDLLWYIQYFVILIGKSKLMSRDEFYCRFGVTVLAFLLQSKQKPNMSKFCPLAAKPVSMDALSII